jgi:hypothetical protein
MRAHQPGSTPIDIPETVPNPAYTPAPTPAPAPERAPTKVPEKVPENAYDDLIRSLDKILKDANFEELPHEEVTDAHRKRTLRVEVKAGHDDFREVRFYKRGRAPKTL